jgi:uncharacterized protein with FMN-binding domain
VKRAPIVIAGTVAGLVAVLEFHTTPAKLTLAGGSSLPSATSGGAGATTQPASGGSATTQPASGGSATTQPASGGSATTQPASGKSTPARRAQSGSTSGQAAVRTATGERVNYNFGVLSVKITVSGGKITKVGIAYLDDSGDPRSQLIDQESIPILEQQTLRTQSASIQGVSGASYTSAGFEQSLQSALHSLGK